MQFWNTIIFIACLGTIWVYSKPTIMLRRWVGFKEEEYDAQSKIKQFFHELLNCSWCITFWIGIITLDIQTMVISAVVANAIEKWIILK